MDYHTYLCHLVKAGIKEIREKYPDYESSSIKDKVDGAIAGFQACKNRNPDQLYNLLETARLKTKISRKERGNYWYYRSYELQVQWVAFQIVENFPNTGLRGLLPRHYTISVLV